MGRLPLPPKLRAHNAEDVLTGGHSNGCRQPWDEGSAARRKRLRAQGLSPPDSSASSGLHAQVHLLSAHSGESVSECPCCPNNDNDSNSNPSALVYNRHRRPWSGPNYCYVTDKKQRKAEVWKGDISSSKIRSALGGRMSLGPLTQYTAPRSSRQGDWGWWWQGAPWSSDYRKHIAWTPLPPTLKRAPLNRSPPIQNFCTWEPTRKLLMPFSRPEEADIQTRLYEPHKIFHMKVDE